MVDYDVYSLVVDSLYVHESTERILLAGCSQVWNGYGGPEPGLGIFEDLLPGLPESLEKEFVRFNHASVRIHDHLDLTVPYEIVTDSGDCADGFDLEKMSSSVEAGPPRIFTVSRVGYSADRSEGLLLTEFRCGPRCGGGTLVWVRHVAGEWEIVDAKETWTY